MPQVMYILIWWLIIQVFGWLALPLAYRLLRWLPDRGYTVSKVLGLLLVSFLLWIGASTGLLRNDVGGILLAMIAVGGISTLVYLKYPGKEASAEQPSLLDFLRQHRNLILAVEILFLVAFVAGAGLRAFAAQKIMEFGGEKWMEITFLNGILKSSTFPPLDPWMSGFSIAYYYFGYVMMAIMTRLSGAPAGVGFDLYDALLLALTMIGAFGIVYNLVPAGRKSKERTQTTDGQSIRYGLLASILVTIMGNLEGFLESLYSGRILSTGVWKWFTINGWQNAQQTGNFAPSGYWWWWRASRVVWDTNLVNQPLDNPNITEFPFFSFLLGDNHPHVLALPFILLAIVLALNLLRRLLAAGQQQPEVSHQQPAQSQSLDPERSEGEEASPSTVEGSTAGGKRRFPAWLNPVNFSLGGDWFFFGMYALCLGALGFLNTWDWPVYLGLNILVYGVGLYAMQPADSTRRLDRNLILRTASLGVGWFLGGFILFSYYYFGFQTQARGILPYIDKPTRLTHYLMMFGPFIFILAGFLVAFFVRTVRQSEPGVVRKWLTNWVAVMVGILVVFALLLTLMVLGDPIFHLGSNSAIQGAIGDLTLSEALGKSLLSRFTNPWVFILVTALLTLAATNTYWHARSTGRETTEEKSGPRLSPSVLFVFVLIFVGLLLTLSVEFVYLFDNFGDRMNTVFKFYFQAWVMMACASAYGVWWVLNRGEKAIGRIGRYLFQTGAVLLIVAGMFYPFLATSSRVRVSVFDSQTQSSQDKLNPAPNLDGSSNVARDNPDDWAAIQWLRANVQGAPVILEAISSSTCSYQYEGRISAFTGLPTVLGWQCHEAQWRGSYTEQGIREIDIKTIYSSRDTETTLQLLDKWNVKYVIIGQSERDYITKLCEDPANGCTLNLVLRKFNAILDIVFNQELVTIYEVP